MIPSVPELSVLRGVVAICVGFLLGCSQSATLPDTEPSVARVAGEFKGYRQMTAGLVFVNPEFLVQCAPVSKEQVEAARKKSGPHANTGIEIYMNEFAAKAFLAKTNSFPAGAVIVKAKQMRGDVVGNEQAVSDGVGGMINVRLDMIRSTVIGNISILRTYRKLRAERSHLVCSVTLRRRRRIMFLEPGQRG